MARRIILSPGFQVRNTVWEQVKPPEHPAGGITVRSSILLLDDDTSFTKELSKSLSDQYSVSVASTPSDAMGLISKLRPNLMLLDFNMPDMTGLEFLKLVRRRFEDLRVIMLTGQCDADTIIETIRNGATDFVVKGSDDFEANLRFRINKALEETRLLLRNKELSEENIIQSEKNKKLLAKIGRQERSAEIIGNSPSVLKLRSDILKVKGNEVYVLITGENGTGKELVAKNVSLQEEDPSRPFITVNCAAIPATLFESEFFGHVKGAFTGATESRPGQFKMADGGDIFLDEVGEIPIEMQAKLLRVLQEQTFTPVGGSKPVSVKVRVIAATNRNLENEVKNGKFREDLYYRLNRFKLEVAPLRERPLDIIVLAEEFLERFLPGAKLSEPAKKFIQNHPWPGNIRELQNSIERASVHARGSSRPIIKVEHLGLNPNSKFIPEDAIFIPENLIPSSQEAVTASAYQRCINWIEKIFIEKSLDLFNGDNYALYTKLEQSKAHFYRRKKAVGLVSESQTESTL